MRALHILLIPLLLIVSSCSATSPLALRKTINKIKTTAYTEKERDHLKYKKKTAIGTTLKANKSIATSWDIFPVGTVLEINGNNYTVDDYGSALVKSPEEIPVVDIYQPSRRSMNKWGVRYFENVAVVKWGSYEESAQILKERLKYRHCRTMYTRILAKL